MSGWNLSESAHLIQLLAPQNISGGRSTLPFSMTMASHASILVQFGASAAPPQSLVLYQAATSDGFLQTALGFRYSYIGVTGSGHDVMSGSTVVDENGLSTAYGTGEWPAANLTGLVFAIELDSSDLTAINKWVPGAFDWLQLKLDCSNATYCSAVAVLSGLRLGGRSSASMT